MNFNRWPMQVRRILVPVDFRECTVRALQYARAFAREYKATITLLHVVQPDGSHVRRNISRERWFDEMREAGEIQLRKLTDVLWGDEVITDIVIATGKIFQQIVNEAKEVNADLIIMGSHQANGSSRLFHRSTTERVVRTARCPVLVMHALEHGFIKDVYPAPCTDQ